MPLDEVERLKQIREYAWNWFSYHAAQRTNMFNYFLAAAALLVAGFATAAANGSRGLAIIIAIVGAVISFFFMRLDLRNEELVGVGKKAVQAVERVLFQVPKTDKPEAAGMTVRILDMEFPAGIALEDVRKDQPNAGFLESFQRGKHGVFLRLIEQTMCGFFLLAIAVAAIFPGSIQDKGTQEPGKADTSKVSAQLDALKTAIDNSVVNQQASQDRLRASVSQTTTDLTARLDELEQKLGNPSAGGTADKPRMATKAARATRKRRGPTTR
jgi:hypothetical protein